MTVTGKAPARCTTINQQTAAASEAALRAEAAELNAICDQVNRLAMLHGDPERFHVIKDEVAKRLRSLAKSKLDGKAAASDHTWRQPGAPPLLSHRPTSKRRRPT